MKKITSALNAQFKTLLAQNKITPNHHAHYLKWLRNYLDFCHKYVFDESSPQSLPNFIKKLKEKKQTAAQQKQAGSAIHIYYNLIQPESGDQIKQAARGVTKTPVVKETSGSFRTASSQNQAFNALLFFYRHVLNREFGKIDGVVRAKRKPYIPVVLSRAEIDTITANLKYPYDLVVKLLYGCWLRLFECLKPRNTGATTSMKAMFKRPSSVRSINPKSVSGPRPIPFVTVSQAICCKPITTSARYRSFWGTAMSEPQ